MTQSSQQAVQVDSPRSAGILPAVGRAGVEIALIAVLYVGYVVSRTFADTAFAPARGRALDILTFEKSWRIDIESWLNQIFFDHEWLGVASSYWYATTHYFVTLGVLIWLYRRSRPLYLTARRSLVAASLIGLAFYLLMPTAPPRLVQYGYHDILSLHSNIGWWSANGSAPKGMGDITNDLAAFPSLHAGWALWVAISLFRHSRWPALRVAGWVYAAATAVVIVGTGNHWVIDVLVGWLVVVAGWLVADGLPAPADRQVAPPDGPFVEPRARTQLVSD